MNTPLFTRVPPVRKPRKPRKRLPALRLFVWEGFSPNWTSGLAVAVARTEEQARELVIAKSYNPSDWGTLTIHPLTKAVAFAVAGGG